MPPIAMIVLKARAADAVERTLLARADEVIEYGRPWPRSWWPRAASGRSR